MLNQIFSFNFKIFSLDCRVSGLIKTVSYLFAKSAKLSFEKILFRVYMDEGDSHSLNAHEPPILKENDH